MTQDEIIEMAKQAGWQYAHGESGFEPLWDFAKLIAAKATATEREACAEIAETSFGVIGSTIALAIRARGEQAVTLHHGLNEYGQAIEAKEKNT